MSDKENNLDNNIPDIKKESTPIPDQASEKKKKILKIMGIIALIFIALPILIFGTCILLLSGF